MSNEEYPLYKDLVSQYEEGKLKVETGKEWVVYYLTEERQKLGTKYLHYSPLKELILLIEWDKKVKRDFLNKLLWDK